MKPELDKFYLVREYTNGVPVYFDTEFFAASKVDLRLTVRCTYETQFVRQYEAHCVQTHSVLKLSKTKSN